MATRAVSAGKLWLAPLAVLVLVVATPVAAMWMLSTNGLAAPLLALLVFAAGLVAIAAAGRWSFGLGSAVVPSVLTWAVAFVAWPIWYAIGIHTSACGKSVAGGWGWLPPTGGALVFLAVGGWGLRTYRIWGAPLALVLAIAVTLLLVLAVPGTQGICET